MIMHHIVIFLAKIIKNKDVSSLQQYIKRDVTLFKLIILPREHLKTIIILTTNILKLALKWACLQIKVILEKW